MELIKVTVKIFSLFPLTTPETVASIYWDIIYGLTLLVFIFYIPMKISFEIQLDYLIWFTVVVYLVNVILTLSRGFYRESALILNRKEIVENYIRNDLIFDFVVLMALVKYDVLLWIFFFCIPKLS